MLLQNSIQCLRHDSKIMQLSHCSKNSHSNSNTYVAECDITGPGIMLELIAVSQIPRSPPTLLHHPSKKKIPKPPSPESKTISCENLVHPPPPQTARRKKTISPPTNNEALSAHPQAARPSVTYTGSPSSRRAPT